MGPLLRTSMLALVIATGCVAPTPISGSAREAGFLTVPPRDVVVHGSPVRIDAEARLFYTFAPADSAPETRPILVVSNGFSARIVRAYGMGPTTVRADGSVVANPDSLTRFANVVWIDPRQSGFSYDVIRGRRPNEALDCSSTIFNEYVDASDFLFATFAFLRMHPALRGPLVWVGESYAAIRIQWVLAFLRRRFALAPFDDPSLRAEIAAMDDGARSLRAGQVLIQPWVVGSSQTSAIAALDHDPDFVASVESELGASCDGGPLAACVKARGRSLYDVRIAESEQRAREWTAAAAHVDPERARALFGVPLESIAGLAERKQGFRCNHADDETPSDQALSARFGALPSGQSYFVPSSPLQPDKSSDHATADWWSTDLAGIAFLDHLDDVPTLVTDGKLDLVAPFAALPGALGAVLDAGAVHRTRGGLEVVTATGGHTIAVSTHPDGGHMITLDEPRAFADEVSTWLPR